MKATPEQLSLLRAAIQPLDTDEQRALYRQRLIPRADKVKDIDKRYRWDLFWLACHWEFRDSLYQSGLNDTHIDTALKAVVSPL